MRITKYLKTEPSHVVNNIKKIVNFFQEKQYLISKFYLDVTCKDENFYCDNYDEFVNSFSELSVDSFLFEITIFNKDKKIKDIILRLQRNSINGFTVVAISISNINKEDGEDIVDDIAGLLNSKLYRYNPSADQKKVVKQEIYKCISILEKNQEYHLRRTRDINNEKDLQSFFYPILKSHFLNLEEEFFLPKFAGISYMPDFGIPDLKLLIELKYLREVKDLKKIQKEIHDDSVGYIKSSDKYKKMIVLIYNSKNVPVSSKYIKDLEKISVVEKIVVASGVNIKYK